MNDSRQDNSELSIGVEGRLGVITLNRPEAINALTLHMVQGITRQLEHWRDDDTVRAVLFEGRGPRGFCSGGDVRAARSQVLSGRLDLATDFFAAEYRMNGLIAGYDKPVIALCEGVVMGGGIGIAGHADFRFCATGSRFAMPESAIGFVCDIGVNAILARAPVQRALLFELTGLPIGPADALALGLSDCAVPQEKMPSIRQGLVAAAAGGDVATAIVSLMQSAGTEPGEASLCADADRLEEALELTTAGEIVAAVVIAANGDSHFQRLADALEARCPTSLEAILQSHRAARLRQDIDAILAQDLRLAGFLAGRPDFAEGVRSVLVDKDGKPRWDPMDFAAVPRVEIAAIVAGTAASQPAGLSTS